MRYLSVAFVVVFLTVLPPKSRVIDPPKCIGYVSGICLHASMPEEQTIIQTGEDDL